MKKTLLAALVAVATLGGCVAVPYSPGGYGYGYDYDYYAPAPAATFSFGYQYYDGPRYRSYRGHRHGRRY